MTSRATGEQPVRFGVIGVNHNHINGLTDLLLKPRGQLAIFFAIEDDLAAQFASRYPQALRALSQAEILENSGIALVASAAIPDERAGIGIATMQHGKDYLSDKPGFTTLDQLQKVRKVQRETSRIYSICYSERLQNRATVRAGELVRSGAIGRPLRTVGLGPHRLNASSRPAWFFQPDRYGGTLTDIGSHQANQFLFFTGSTSAEVVASQVGNLAHPEYPDLEDFGDMLVRGDRGTGYIRVDWFTPDGLSTWGGGRPGGDHLLLVNQRQTQYVDCSQVELPFGPQLLDDIQHRTKTAMPQAHTFLASELALRAQLQAKPVRAATTVA